MARKSANIEVVPHSENEAIDLMPEINPAHLKLDQLYNHIIGFVDSNTEPVVRQLIDEIKSLT